MNKKWTAHPPVDEAVRLAREFAIHPIIASLLHRRGYCTRESIQRFIQPSLDRLESPFVFQDMQKAVHRISQAIADNQKILIFGDYDVDGVTASAILYPVLKDLGADVEVHIPHRLNEGYGMNRASLEPWIKKKIGLVVTVDNGITGVDAVKYLNDHKVDVVIVDHHVPKDEVPPAFAIISSSTGDQKGDPNLAACGLAFKLVWALYGDLKKALSYLDLVTLGTVADLAPVCGDNRILLKQGLSYLCKMERIGLRTLMQTAKIDPRYVSYRDIAFGLGPRINASGRMGSPLNAFKLLVTTNAVEARNLAQILEEGNRDRQKVESNAYLSAAKLVEDDSAQEDRRVIVVQSPDWHEGVLGIVASRLVERFKKPSIVIATKNGVGKGSGRSLPGFSIFKSVLACEDLLLNFGGHAQACGLTMAADKVDLFRDRLNVAAHLESGDDHRSDAPAWVDAEIKASDLDPKFLKELELLEPFGPGHPKPLFLSRKMRVRGDIKKRGKDTLQCWMTDADGKLTCEVIGFRAYDKWQAQAAGQKEYDIIYQPTLRNFNGIQTITLELEDWI